MSTTVMLTQQIVQDEAMGGVLDALGSGAAEADAWALAHIGDEACRVLGLLPEGWGVLREVVEATEFRGSATIFTVRDDACKSRATVERRQQGRLSDRHAVQPRMQGFLYDADEARGRAVVMLLAALDAEARSCR